MKVILSVVVGSTAYGLATPESDIDLRGVYVAPTQQVLGLFPPKETIDQVQPDICYHEVEKFIRLALKCNPSILEMLYMPEYVELTEEGRLLTANRSKFLSNTVFAAYGGYAIAQIKKLNERGDSFSAAVRHRYAKHARHCFRLLSQGRQLLGSGELTVKVTNREELFKVGEMSPLELAAKFEEEYSKFENVRSALPDEPDYDVINKVLLKIRGMN